MRFRTLPRDFAMKLRGFSLLLCPLLVLLILTEYASATLVRTLDSGTITNGFILDSDELDGDPNTDLNGLLANFQATVSVASAPFLESHTADYRLAYQLRDSNGNTVRLVNGDALDTAYTAAETVSLTDFVIFPAVANPTQTINFRALPDPLAILSGTKERYSVSGTLQVSVDEGKITPASSFVDLGADSLDTVELLMALEEEFGVEIPEDEAQKLTTVQAVIDYAKAQGK